MISIILCRARVKNSSFARLTLRLKIEFRIRDLIS